MFRIITESGELDTYKEVDVSFNYQLDDVIDISKRKSSYSKTIRLPGTPNNNKFFKQIFDINVNKRINVKKRIRATVRNGSNAIINGYLQLLDIYNEQDKIEYEVSITQNNKNIWEDMKDYNISDLDFSRYNHTRNKQAIVDSWETYIYEYGITQSAQLGKGYVYPSIVYGNNLDDIQTFQYTGDSYPALYIKEIWDSMFDFLGYEYNSQFLNSEYFKRLIYPFTKDKIELSDEEKENRELVVGVKKSSSPGGAFQWGTANVANEWHIPNSPWLKRDDGWSSAQLIKLYDESSAYGGPNADTEFNDEGNQWNNQTTLGFKASNSGYYDIDINLQCRMQGRSPNGADIRWAGNDGAVKYTWKCNVYKNNGTVIQHQPLDNNGNTTSEDWVPNDDNWRGWNGATPPIFDEDGEEFPISFILSNIHLNAGERVKFFIYLKVGNQKIFNTKNSSQGNNTDIRLLIARNIGDIYSKFSVSLADTSTPPNEEINMNNILDGKMKMQDFFKSILDMFNLLIIEDPKEEGKLLIEPREDFYRSRQRVKDWNQILDRSDTIKMTPMSELDAKSYIFTYKSDDDWLNKEYENAYGEVYGELEVDTFDEFAEDSKNFKLEFSPTPDGSILSPNRVMPYFIEKDGQTDFKSKKVKPRILFYGGSLSTSTYYIIDYAGDPNPQQCNTYAYCGMWDHPTDPRWDLGFGRTKTIYWNTSLYPTNNLYNMYHKDYISNIIDWNNVLLEGMFYLTDKDIHDFDFRDIIFLDGSYWRIVDIKNYNPISSNKTTKVKLIKILNYETYDASNNSVPASNGSCPVDVKLTRDPNLGWIYYSPSDAISEDCCNSLNGSWNNGVCSIREASGAEDIFKPISGPNDTGNGDSGVVNPYTGKDTVRYPTTSQDTVSPIVNEYGPDTNKKNYNTTHNTSNIIKGSSNYIDYSAKNSIILGNDNTVNNDGKNAIIIGDNITANKGTGIYIGNVFIDENGEINNLENTPSVIIGGVNEVMRITKTNDIDLLIGGIDSVRNLGGDSKKRPIILGGNSDSIDEI